VDPQLFASTPQRRAAARAELSVPGDALLVGTVGNRNPDKQHGALVRAAAMVRARGVDIWVRILGQPSPAHAEYMARVEAEVGRLGMGDRVSFVDPGTRVPDLLPALDIFALPSRSEGLPTVLLEAMSAQLPVVSTDVGSVRELITAEVGILVPALEDGALAAAIQRLAEDPELRRRLGTTGRRLVEDRYAIDRCAELYAGAFELALSHRASR
jgi:glycosyltransferase involved in cell wall biosynthesis